MNLSAATRIATADTFARTPYLSPGKDKYGRSVVHVRVHGTTTSCAWRHPQTKKWAVTDWTDNHNGVMVADMSKSDALAFATGHATLVGVALEEEAHDVLDGAALVGF